MLTNYVDDKIVSQLQGKMFGKPQPDIRQNVMTQYENYPAAFGEVNLGVIVDGLLIDQNINFLTERICPKQEMDGTVISWERLYFDRTILEKVNPEGPGRRNQHTKERYRVGLTRRGSAIHLDSEYIETPAGKQMVMYQLLQIINDTNLTAGLLVLTRLLSCHKTDEKYIKQYVPNTYYNWDDYLNKEIDYYCIASKKGSEGLKNIVVDTIALNASKGRPPLTTCIITPVQKMFITNIAPLTTTGIFPGEHDKPINNNVPGSFGTICNIPVFEAPDVSEQLENGDTNPMQTLSIIGGHVCALSNYTTNPLANSDKIEKQQEYRQSRTIKILNETAGCDYPITLADMCKNALWECVFPADTLLKKNAVAAIFKGGNITGITNDSTADEVREVLANALASNDEKVLKLVNRLSFILFRPCQKYITEKMIMCRDGKSFGATMVGPTNFEWSSQGNIGTKHGLFTIWIQAVILDVSGVYVLENIMYRAYLGGCDTDFLDNKDVGTLITLNYDYLEASESSNNIDKKSIFCFPIPADTEFYQVKRLIDMTGSIKNSNSREKPKEGNPGYYPGCEVVYEYLQAGTIKQQAVGLSYVDSKNVLFNTICPREGSKNCSDPERRLFDDVIPNSNHHGPNTEPGCEKVRRGMATGVTFTNVRNYN